MNQRIRLISSALILANTSVGFAIDSTNLPCGIRIGFISTNQVVIGEIPTWTVSIINTSSTDRTCEISLEIAALGYNGEHWASLYSVSVTNAIGPGATSVVSSSISPSDYANWPGATLRGLCAIAVLETNELWVSVSKTGIITPTNILFISPSSPVLLGSVITAAVSYLNPYSFDLKDVTVDITGDEVLDTNGLVLRHHFLLGTVGSNEYVAVATNFIAAQLGTAHVWVAILASNLTDISTYRTIEIEE